MKKKTFSASIMAALLTAGIASTQAAAGILAEGNISVYKGGNLPDTITGQNPVDEEALLVCNNKCMIKTTGISIVGATGTELAVKSDQEQFNLLLKEGQVDFILSGTIGKMGFYSADRQYTSADVIYNASTVSPVRGYMQVTPEGRTKIGVYEGQLVFDTVEGAKTIGSNNYILLAQADIGEAPVDEAFPPAEENDDDDRAGAWWSNGAITAGTVVAGATAWGVYEYLDDEDEDNPAANNANGQVETTPPSQTPAGTSPNTKASKKAAPPAFPRNPSPNR